MNICKQLHYSSFFFLTLIASINLAAMDRPQLLLEKTQKKPIVYGKLFIDPIENPSSSLYPHHICKKNNPIEYLTQEHRQSYPHAKQFRNESLRAPFAHVIIAPKNNPTVKIFTVIPATQLLNCTDGSIIDISTDKCIFRLTCAKNGAVIIKGKYAPKDDGNTVEKQGITFKTQLESCMNQFYAKLSYCSKEQKIQELVQNEIINHEITRGQHAFTAPTIGNPHLLFIQPFIIHKYTHGKDGCSNSQDLINLATARTTKPYGSRFDFVMNRQHTPSHIQQRLPIARDQRIKYAHDLENVKKLGNKSPMEKTIHYSKSPALDIPNTIALAADAAPDQLMLDTILEDCLIEFTTQTMAQQHPARPSTKRGDCLIL